MKLLKHKKQEPDPEQEGKEAKEERIGRPMLLPIIFCLISGLLLILLKDLTMKITGYMFSAILIVSGFWLLIGYFRATPLVRIMESKLAIGLILLVTGSLMAFSPESLSDLLPYAWGLALLFGGFLKIQYAVDRKTLGAEKWWILLFFAAFSLIIGVISLLNHDFLGENEELVIGILLTVEAVLDLSVFLLLKRKIRKITADTPAPAADAVPQAALTETENPVQQAVPAEAETPVPPPAPAETENPVPQPAPAETENPVPQPAPAETEDPVPGTEA